MQEEKLLEIYQTFDLYAELYKKNPMTNVVAEWIDPQYAPTLRYDGVSERYDWLRIHLLVLDMMGLEPLISYCLSV